MSSDIDWETMFMDIEGKLHPSINHESNILPDNIIYENITIIPNTYEPPTPQKLKLYSSRKISKRKTPQKSNTNNINLPGEVWKRVPYDDIKPLYVSNYGRVKSHLDRIVKGTIKNGRSYARIVYKDTKQSTETPLDRLIAFTFIGEGDTHIIHIDGNNGNNRLENIAFF